jgi:Na+/proline symporter
MLDASLPAGWRSLWPSWRLDIDWNSVLPAAQNKIIKQDGWQLFGALFSLLLVKGYLQSMAGPAPNYDMQRVLSARSPREAALMSWFVNLVLLVPRYMLITGLTVLAIVYFKHELGGMGENDFELILPLAMKNFVPAGLFGLLIAALLAAFMSTYAATVNAAPAYIVNDIYKRYVNPDAPEKTYVWMSYATSLIVVVIGTAFGFMTEQLNDVVKWLTFALFGGYTAANVLKWHWWRFNSYGYFWGMLAGMASAGAMPSFLQWLSPDSPTIWGDVPQEVLSFPMIFALSLAGCIFGSLLTAPDDLDILKTFYLKVRPWGFWSPIHDLVALEQPGLQANRDFRRDMINIVVGIVWQTALTAAGIYLVLQDWRALSAAGLVIAATSLFLKFNWYDKLQDYPDHAEPSTISG